MKKAPKPKLGQIKILPVGVYVTTTYMYTQRQVVEALNLKMPEGTVQVFCDGTNKLRVEVTQWRGTTKDDQ